MRVLAPVAVGMFLVLAAMLLPRLIPRYPRRGRVYMRLILMLACVVSAYGINILYSFAFVELESFTALLGIFDCVIVMVYLTLDLLPDALC